MNLKLNLKLQSRQGGMALVVMLIILVVLMVGSLYLMKAGTSTTVVTANLAYDSAMSKAADLGLHAGAKWLGDHDTPATKAVLLQDSAANGYVATYDPGVPPSSENFWAGKATIADPNDASISVDYVIRRMCSTPGAFDVAPNTCVQTSAPAGANGGVPVGESLSSDATPLPGPPQLHYVITARIAGSRGGYVINQMVVLIGA
jgi:hypothetical protein